MISHVFGIIKQMKYYMYIYVFFSKYIVSVLKKLGSRLTITCIWHKLGNLYWTIVYVRDDLARIAPRNRTDCAKKKLRLRER